MRYCGRFKVPMHDRLMTQQILDFVSNSIATPSTIPHPDSDVVKFVGVAVALGSDFNPNAFCYSMVSAVW